jgi:ATP-binding cassette subfamily B protein
VIENGEIIEQGTHEELLALKGYYYNTLNSQLKENLA